MRIDLLILFAQEAERATRETDRATRDPAVLAALPPVAARNMRTSLLRAAYLAMTAAARLQTAAEADRR